MLGDFLVFPPAYDEGEKSSSAGQSHFLSINATSLSASCNDSYGPSMKRLMDIAVVDGSRECTKEVHANATKISLSNDIFYGMDANGATNGWYTKLFKLTDSEMEADDFYALRPVVFFYDAKSNHVACVFLELLSDEDKEKYDTIFNGEQDAVALGDDGSPTSGRWELRSSCWLCSRCDCSCGWCSLSLCVSKRRWGLCVGGDMTIVELIYKEEGGEMACKLRLYWV